MTGAKHSAAYDTAAQTVIDIQFLSEAVDQMAAEYTGLPEATKPYAHALIVEANMLIETILDAHFDTCSTG
jgi:hypothetical protein